MKMWLAQINLNRPKKSVKWIEGKVSSIFMCIRQELIRYRISFMYCHFYLQCPRQPNNTDCGYYVLRYILDIIRMEQDSYPGEVCI